MIEFVVAFMLIGLNTSKYSEDLDVSTHATNEQCVAEALEEGWSEWVCIPVAVPKGQDFLITNSN